MRWRRGGSGGSVASGGSQGVEGHDIGMRGEMLAAEHLQSQGWRVLDQNIRVGRGEVDILAQSPDRQWIAIVEVKTRLGAGVDPAYRITRHKKQMLKKAAGILKERSGRRSIKWRLDVVTVDLSKGEPPTIVWYQNAI